MTSGKPLIRLEGITKEYRMDAELVRALRGVDLEIYENEMVAIMGSSGSGKSTMLNILGLLDVPTAGRYWLDDQDVAQLSQSSLRVSGAAALASSSRPLNCCPARRRYGTSNFR